MIAELPHLPGVYRMLDGQGRVLYVGKANDLRKRVGSYWQSGRNASPRIEYMVRQVHQIEVTVTRSESEALLLENNFIKALLPRYNILYRDDKSYPYLRIGSGQFPRLAFYRGAVDEKSQFFGPFPNAGAVRASIQLIQKVFRLRTCEDTVFRNRSRPCLLQQIQRCTGPCVGLIDRDAYAENVADAKLFLGGHDDLVIDKLARRMESASARLAFEEAATLRDQVKALRRVRESQFVDAGTPTDADVVACEEVAGRFCVNVAMIRAGRHVGDRSLFPEHTDGASPAEVLLAFLSQHYLEADVPAQIIVNQPIEAEALLTVLSEQAGRKVHLSTHPREIRRKWLEMASQNARLALERRVASQQNQEARLAALQEALKLSDIVRRIECFDVSHTMGEAAVASCVVYDGDGMRPGEYRRYNVTPDAPGDDYAAMREVLERRFKRLVSGEGRLPDLVLIDGGKGQSQIARAVLNDLGVNDVPVVGVAKGEARRPGLETLVFTDGRESLQLAADHPGAHLVQQIRDEAHRFAIQGHRARRDKKRVGSALDAISGVGPKRRQQLLSRFGGLRGVTAASEQDLMQVGGISHSLAERIYRALH
ncbi:MAG: excinuclease ABC subunit UvrC [Proteobacteria bacterium]|nr:excinuclease ABC subunit UvrC [Burkholderiales bacterium]